MMMFVVVYPPGLRGRHKCQPLGFCLLKERGDLATESVDGPSLAFQGVDDVQGGDGLAAGVFCVGDRVTDDGLQERLEDSAGLFVDQAGDALHSTTTSKASDGGLGDSLDVVPKDLAVALGSALAETLSSLATSGHLELDFFDLVFCEKCCKMKSRGIYHRKPNQYV